MFKFMSPIMHWFDLARGKCSVNTALVLAILWLSLVTGARAATATYISGEQLQDPTAPLGYRPAAGKPSDAFVLNSILHSSERKQAVINGKTVRENEYIAGALVKRIASNSVEILMDGKPYTLMLRQQLIKTRSN